MNLGTEHGAFKGGERREGLFLSAVGLERVHAAYEAMRGRGKVDILNSAPAALWGDRWSAFDDLYLALYVGRTQECHAPAGDHPSNWFDFDLEMACRLFVVLDVDFPSFDPKATFEQTLLNEYAVVDLMHFRAAVQRLLPYPIRLQRFRLGCVELEFGVWGPARRSENIFKPPELPGLDPAALRNKASWQSISRRFKVVDHIELRPV